MFNLISVPVWVQAEKLLIGIPLELQKPCRKISFDIFSTLVIKERNPKPKRKKKNHKKKKSNQKVLQNILSHKKQAS